MKNKIILIGTAILAVVTVGCGDALTRDRRPISTFFPTNHWQVVGQGTNGQVVVESTSTNILEHLRVHVSEGVVRLTNGQSVRVEISIRKNWDLPHGVELVHSKAYPAAD